MQFTTSLLALFLTLTSTQAAVLEQRQTGVATALAFTDSSCGASGGTQAGSATFIDDGTSACHLTELPATAKSVRVTLNGATRPLNIYSRDNCTRNGSPAGNVITYPAFSSGCQSQASGLVSYNFGPIIG